MHIVQAAYDICKFLQDAGHEAYLVGGCVRDWYMARQPKDWDVATSALPASVEMICSRFARVYSTGLKHGTVTVLLDKIPIEVTTFRNDGVYADGRRPDNVKFGVPLEEDLERRDFTMNAIAMDPISRETFDPFNGVRDIINGTIRAVGNPKKRFGEDGLRIMRAIRFASTLGFNIETNTFNAIPSAIETFRKVSSERVRDELSKILLSPKPSYGLRLMLATGILSEVLPELLPNIGCPQNRYHRYDVWEHTLRAVDFAPPRIAVRLAALLHDVAKPKTKKRHPVHDGEYQFIGHEEEGAELSKFILKRLKFANCDVELVSFLVKEHLVYYDSTWKDSAVRRFITKIGMDNLDDLLDLRVADALAHGFQTDVIEETKKLRERCVEQANRVINKSSDLAVNGNDVMELLNLTPGPEVGRILKILKAAATENPELNTRERLLELALNCKYVVSNTTTTV